MPEWIYAYDKLTGKKLVDSHGDARLIPAAHLDIFPNLARTPQGAASAARAHAAHQDEKSTPEPESDHDATAPSGAEEGA